MCKLEGYKCFSSIRSKDKKEKQEKKGMSDNFFQFLQKNYFQTSL
jgi:hypothetical protein